MALLGSQAGWTLPLLLLVVLALAPGSGAVCSNTEPGTLYVATGSANPPPLATPLVNDGINAAYVFNISPGTGFELVSTAAPGQVTIGSVKIVVPDFNVAWYETGSFFDRMIGHDTMAGNEQGVVPVDADYALVYMRYGPDLLGNDQTIGAHFELRMAC